MHSKKYKYQDFLDSFPNCPSNAYTEKNINTFRWVFSECDNNSFIPVLIINPTRQLENDDKKCDGFALSMFEHQMSAYEKYKRLVRGRAKLKDVFGDKIAEIKISVSDGVSSEPESNNYTHFNFHEYEGTDLSLKIVNIKEIFDENGNFKW